MTQDGLCTRPNKDGTPCKNIPSFGDSCSAHLTAEERAKRDRQSARERTQWHRDAQARRETDMTRYLAGFLERFAPFKDGEAELAQRTLAALMGSLHDI
jgi:hypothetical protein